MEGLLAGPLAAVLLMSNCDDAGCYQIIAAKYYGPAGNQFCQEAAKQFNRNATYEVVTKSNQSVIFSCKSVVASESTIKPRM